MERIRENYWSEFEYDKLKLLHHREKVQSLLEVYQGIKVYDNLPPISVEMHLTDKCNLHCPWCTDADLHSIGATLPTEKVYDLLNTFGCYGTGVTLEGGGEPTLHPDFKEIVKYGNRHHVHLGLITNGTVNIKECINDFRWVRISLDSGNREEYIREKGGDQFEHVMENIASYQNLRDVKKCYLGIGYVLTTRNFDHVCDIVKRLDDIGVDYVYLRPVEEAPDITPERNELYDMRKELLKLTEKMRIKFMLTINDRLEYNNANLPCVAHSITSIVHADGNIALCEKRRHDIILLGNVNEQSFDDIWNSQIRKEASKKLMDGECQNGCSVCRITPFNKIISNLENMNTEKFI